MVGGRCSGDKHRKGHGRHTLTSELDSNATVVRTIEIEGKMFKSISTMPPNSSMIQIQVDAVQIIIAKTVL